MLPKRRRVRLGSLSGSRSRSGLDLQSGKLQLFALNASIFIFFFSRPRISRGIHFFALGCPEINCQGRMARTTASRTVRMNTLRVVSHSRQYKQEIGPY